MSDELLTITFGLLKEEFTKVETCLNWKVEENEAGVFMIKTKRQLSNFDKVIVKKNNEIIWGSNIRTAPEKNLELPFSTSEENVYISAKPIRSTELPFGDNIYDVILISREEEIGRGVLMVNEKREEKEMRTPQAKVYDMEDVSSKQGVAADGIPNVEYQEEQKIQETPRQEEPKKEYKEEIKEEPKIERFESKPEPKVEQKKESVSEDHSDSKSVKTKLIEILSDFAPVNISLKLNDKCNIKDYSKSDIIIEKTGNTYVTVLNNFFGRRNYLLRNEEKSICWENSFIDYMDWLKNILIKKYNLQSHEIDNLEILIISDDKDIKTDKELRNVNIISRKPIIEWMGKRHGQIVDLKYGCSIYVESEDKSLYIDFEGSQLKDALDFLEDEPTLLIGVSSDRLAEEQILDSLNENQKVKLTNLAWEASISK